jgi:hypothetical protein
MAVLLPVYPKQPHRLGDDKKYSISVSRIDLPRRRDWHPDRQRK